MISDDLTLIKPLGKGAFGEVYLTSKVGTNEKYATKIVEQMKKIIKIKLIILYAISGILIMLFWYYVSAFCAVFKNSQGHYFTNVLVAFIVCNIWPCVISLIPAFLRTKALENKSKKMYIISQIVAYF